MQALIKMIGYDPDFIVPVATFLQQQVIVAVKEEHSQEPPVTKELTTSPDWSPSASVGTCLVEESKNKHSCRRRRDWKDWGHRNRLAELRDKRKKHRRFSSSTSQPDGSLKKSISTSSSLGLWSRPRSSYSVKRKRRTCCEEEKLKKSGSYFSSKSSPQERSQLFHVHLCGHADKVRRNGFQWHWQNSKANDRANENAYYQPPKGPSQSLVFWKFKASLGHERCTRVRGHVALLLFHE